jgi:hypothetical protein
MVGWAWVWHWLSHPRCWFGHDWRRLRLEWVDPPGYIHPDWLRPRLPDAILKCCRRGCGATDAE